MPSKKTSAYEFKYEGSFNSLDALRVLQSQTDVRFWGGQNKSFWCRLYTAIKDVNKAKCFNGPTDTRSYCAFSLKSAKVIALGFLFVKPLMAIIHLGQTNMIFGLLRCLKLKNVIGTVYVLHYCFMRIGQS